MKSAYKTELNNHKNLPFSLRRLVKQNQEWKYDLSKLEYENDIARTVNKEVNIGTESNLNQNKIHNINNLLLYQFRKKLITYFNIVFMHKDMVWLYWIK